jgi:ATP phosphoribosyltransferase regulatory subunit HisZ
MSEALDDLKRELIEKYRLWAIANPQEAAQESEKLAAGIRDIPVRQMLDQLTYIERELLPAVQKRKGREEDYKFFEGVARSLAKAVIVCDRYDYLYTRYINSRIDVALLRDRQQMTEKELERYCTMEDLLLSDSMNKYAEAIAERVKRDILRVKK